MPFPDIEFSPNVIYERETLLSGLAFTIFTFAANRAELTDADSLTAIKTLADTYRTLIAGIYYDRPPEGQPANALYTALANFIQDYKKRETERSGFSNLTESQIFHVLVFLARMARNTTNGRPKSRLFLTFLRQQFPQVQTPQAETSRIIAP